ncbi:Signal transduction histidine kinase [Saccharopolyspora antimicrobica]|uniref:histidine kinase n=1 Tax=Saccharopolyspora antimicrobica TaxID=455193 RepID=A0A1I5DAU0_9PSEU|nr:sensor domain-containing protein [Saccharopolyspora antimicrobica]RKT85183.1 signal transduction histidine kinase [Saccharopolyspora antimicrobica]SFN96313.1 Signal transduction histidine kinase [Saccharopolyspora antimicrobica]
MDLRSAVRGSGVLLLALATGLPALVALPLVLVNCLLVVMGVGIFVLPAAAAVLHRWTEWERRRAGRYLGVQVDPIRSATGFKQVVRSPVTRRDLRWLVVHALFGVVVGLLGLVATVGVPSTLVSLALWSSTPDITLLGVQPSGWGAAFVLAAGQIALAGALFVWGVPPLARAQARISLRLLTPPESEIEAQRLAERVDVLAETRAGALEAHGAELRRIERDLHDGTQAQLVSIALRLGIAEKAAADDPETALRLVREARGGAEEAMAGLRDVVRTLYPPILADRGLAGAVFALGARCAVTTEVSVGDLGEVPAAVEAAAYFVVAESLTNVAKHSGAERATVALTRADGELRVEVGDDGAGGATEEGGTGLTGIRQRVAALDGRTSVHSPAGGPTRIEVALPCGF